MALLSMLPPVTLDARRLTRSCYLAAFTATALAGAVACRSPQRGNLAVAPRSGSDYARQIEVLSTPVGAERALERIVNVELSEWKISLANADVSPGAVTLQVHNGGTIAHVFEIEGAGIERRTRPIAPDSTIALTVNLEPKTYEIYCPLASGMHKKMGMVAKLAVRAEK
jgi:uncharacterized cupredoxin-like copper-binding protein